MKITLPISHLINYQNYKQVPNIDVLQYRGGLDFKNGFDHNMGEIWHDSIPILNSVIYFDAFKYEFDYYSCHLGMATEDVKVKDYYYDGGNPRVYEEDQLFERISNEIQHLKKYCNAFALENTNYYDYPAYKYVCDPNFINRIIEENDIGFCFDIAHAIISAKNMMMDVNDYINLLPLNKVKEIHICKPAITLKYNIDSNEYYYEYIDMHLRPDYGEYMVLDKMVELLPNQKEVYLVVEYYKCFETLCEIYEEIGGKYGSN